ncbi:hypothetical protein ACVWXM_004488 [Bradyrhizobium sp. GM7.3]
MSEQINEQAEKMREMAQTTLDKAKEAVSKYITESQKLREKADSSVRSTYSAAKEMNDKSRRVRRGKCGFGLRACATAVACQGPAGNGCSLSEPSQGADGKNERAVSRACKCNEPAVDC